MLIVSAIMPVKSDCAEDFALAAKICAEKTRCEGGNISYTVCKDIEDSCRFITIEEWEDGDVESLHMQSAHLKEFISEIRGYISAAPKMRRYDVVKQP